MTIDDTSILILLSVTKRPLASTICPRIHDDNLTLGTSGPNSFSGVSATSKAEGTFIHWQNMPLRSRGFVFCISKCLSRERVRPWITLRIRMASQPP